MGLRGDAPISEQVRDLADRYVVEAERQRDAYKDELERLRERLLLSSFCALSFGFALGAAAGVIVMLIV